MEQGHETVFKEALSRLVFTSDGSRSRREPYALVKTARHKQKQKQKQKQKETFPFSSAFAFASASASASASVASENQPSVLMLCTPNNHCQPFSYHTKVMDVEYFCALSVFCFFSC